MHDDATRAETTRKVLLLIFVLGPMAATAYAVWALWMAWVTPLDVGLLIGGWIVTGLGITVGFHRMLTHRSFEAPVWVRAFWLALGSMAVEGGALNWAAIHAEHHVHSDQEGDPHSPLAGFWHAHFGWMWNGFGGHPERYVPQLVGDPLVRWFERTFIVWVGVGLVVPFAVGGLFGGPIGGPIGGPSAPAAAWSWSAAWMALVWGGFVRIFVTHHITWSVNSVCHVFGGRMFETKDVSRNNLIVGLLAFGEGWHNNHHAFPRSAFHGLRWWQIDASGYIIRAMESVGLASDVYRVPRERQELRRKGAGRLTHPHLESERARAFAEEHDVVPAR
ncbi:MAG: acyl-CoA desaturase [Ardenticatenales bacterium]|jgi:stearoyl-CoA desaturase (delta-9 desaturase)|nr:acyl-CoA desaturase [Ardenticatenales bacterium]